MRKLDTSRSYATTHGEGDISHRYEQDGYYFDAQGVECGHDPNYKGPRGGPAVADTSGAHAQLARELAAERAAREKVEAERERERQEANERENERDEETAMLRKQLDDANKALQEAKAAVPSPAEQDAQLRAQLKSEFMEKTVEELHKHLKKASVKFESDANKPALVDLAIEHAMKPQVPK